jgi:hypothetical protein
MKVAWISVALVTRSGAKLSMEITGGEIVGIAPAGDRCR